MLQGTRFQLGNGKLVPAIAFGAGTKWFKYGQDGVSEELVAILKAAMQKGFTHIDGAEVYNTDQEIGAAVGTVDRAAVWVTDKYLGGVNQLPDSPHGLPYDALKHQLQHQLKMDYVDLYLLHAPFYKGDGLETAWRSAERAVDDGLARSIGVSNFAVGDLQKLLGFARIKPVVNQIEHSAYLQNQTPGVVKFCQENDILVMAYSPLSPLYAAAGGALADYLADLGKKHGKTAGQLLLRWVLQSGILPVTTTAKEERIAEYLDVFTFELTADEHATITDLGKKHPTVRNWWTEEYAQFN